jgi:ligand-binding sensor domain-containing protein
VDSSGAPPERGPETIAEDKVHGGVYLATSHGLLRIPASGRNQWVPGTEGKIVWSVFTDRRGKTWFARTSGVCAISSGTRCYGAAADVPADSWGGLVVDFAGTVWARSAQRLIAMEPGETRFRRRDHGLPYASNIGALSLDSHGNLLVPTGVGLAVRASDRRSGPEWVVVGAEAGLVVPTVPWAMADREGLIWIGMRGGGVACWLGPGEWQNWTTRQGLKSDEIWAITRDRKGRLLAGTTYGVSTLDHGRFRSVIQIRRQLSRDRVSSIVVNNDNSLWLGTAPGGLFRYDPSTGELRHFDERDGIAAETVYSLAGRDDGSIWAGSLRGIYRGVREHGRWIFHKETVGTAHEGEYFIQILLDRSGRLWAAGSEGLAVWQGGVWTRIRSDNRQVGRLGGRLAEAPDGAIWFAGRDEDTLERITGNGMSWNVEKAPEAGEFGPQVTWFLGFDHQGNLWRGTGSGVNVLVRGHWVRYSRSDGLVWDDTDANAFFADADNSVWLGTTGGLSHHLRAASGVPVNAAAEIVQIRAGERTADRPAQFRLRYGEGAIAIDYAALTFRRPRDIRFRYRMNGIDEGWTQTSEWEARYGTLPPGHYTFEVESGTWDDGWFGQPATMTLMVIGPWWRSRWFATAATALGVALFLLFWRYREREHQRLQRQLVVAVKERTDELQMERTRERDSNAILEMIVGNRPSGDVLDAIGDLICAHTGADMSCVLERRGDSQIVISAQGLPRLWKAALSNPGVVPFEAWRTRYGGLCWPRLANPRPS